MSEKESIQIADQQDFRYHVVLEYCPQFGFANLLHNDRIIGQVESYRLLPVTSDDDQEHEQYQAQLEDWKCEIKSDAARVGRDYFNKT